MRRHRGARDRRACPRACARAEGPRPGSPRAPRARERRTGRRGRAPLAARESARGRATAARCARWPPAAPRPVRRARPPTTRRTCGRARCPRRQRVRPADRRTRAGERTGAPDRRRAARPRRRGHETARALRASRGPRASATRCRARAAPARGAARRAAHRPARAPRSRAPLASTRTLARRDPARCERTVLETRGRALHAPARLPVDARHEVHARSGQSRRPREIDPRSRKSSIPAATRPTARLLADCSIRREAVVSTCAPAHRPRRACVRGLRLCPLMEASSCASPSPPVGCCSDLCRATGPGGVESGWWERWSGVRRPQHGPSVSVRPRP